MLNVDDENTAKLKSELTIKEEKIEKKKRTLQLHREQITVLKEQLRKNGEEINGLRLEIKELEGKLQSSMAINLPYLKQIYANLITKIKVDKGTEDLISILFKILDFSNEELDKIQQQRKGFKKLSKTSRK